MTVIVEIRRDHRTKHRSDDVTYLHENEYLSCHLPNRLNICGIAENTYLHVNDRRKKTTIY